MLEELDELPIEALFLGCRTGAEIEILEQLLATRAKIEVRYLGPLSGRDVRKLAKLVRPTAAKEIARQALAIASREHLSRTPFTFSLLISALVTNEVFAAPASETALLDAYVSLLLGRGDPHDDARFAFDAVEREAMLARLAGYMVQERAGAIDESDAISVLQAYFESVDWTEDPIDVLTNLRARRVIAIRHGRIRFVQSSFLHLFAAKFAVQNSEFREAVFASPLFFAPILKHYAALSRGDQEAVRAVGGLLAPESPMLGPSGAFADWGVSSHAAIDLDKFLDHIEELSEQDSSVSARPRLEDASEESLDESDFFEFGLYSSTDIEPFPLASIEDMPPLQQAITTVQLVSNVLRDSELVTDLDLKTSVLANVLGMWADVSRLMDSDEGYQKTLRFLASAVADSLDVSEKERSRVKEEILLTSSAISVVGGISSNLSSRKLFRTIQRALSDERLAGFQAGEILAALLAFDVMAPGFGTVVLDITKRYPNAPAVNVILHRFVFAAYLWGGRYHTEDEEALCEALVSIMSSSSPRVPPAQIKSRLRQLRVRSLKLGVQGSPPGSRAALLDAQESLTEKNDD